MFSASLGAFIAPRIAKRAAILGLAGFAAFASAPAKADLFSDLFGSFDNGYSSRGASSSRHGYSRRSDLAGGYTPRADYSSYDRGGNVLDYYEQVRSANVTRRTVAIDGYCASACTMKLGARHACVSPEATLRFHSARTNEGETSWGGNTLMMSVYPPAIQAWVRRHQALDSLAFTDMSGREAIGLGIRACA
ncbi:hypothetical protein [Methylosinus sp. C49]|uniref:hypothetical protein n=1 Tax=Methylosinus sp. C49 TaxID=2699395 RepID=UPI00137A9592|nr:hypothetical protein [Methylosinus sp. C49]